MKKWILACILAGAVVTGCSLLKGTDQHDNSASMGSGRGTAGVSTGADAGTMGLLPGSDANRR